MVDKERRKKLALHLRHLSVGQITNDDFEDRIANEVSFAYLPEHYYKAKEAKTDDPIIRPMLELSWCLYNDTTQHKLTGEHKLSEEQLKDIARYILFLHSDFEYEWPYIDPTNPLLRFSFKELLLSVLTLGTYYKDKIKEREQQLKESQHLGDFDLWPFFNQADYEWQLTKPPFLNGSNNI